MRIHGNQSFSTKHNQQHSGPQIFFMSLEECHSCLGLELFYRGMGYLKHQMYHKFLKFEPIFGKFS